MSTRTFTGSCHCGAVRYEADLDLEATTYKCNCSICTKTRTWVAFTSPDGFRLLAGDDALVDYRIGADNAHHFFCRTCGVRPFGRNDKESLGGPFYTIRLNTLDDADESELGAASIFVADGRNDDWETSPAHTAHL
jgi:hypothetical protein